MRKLYYIIATALLLSFFVGPNQLRAQVIETGEYIPYYFDGYDGDNMPIDVKEATQPAMVAAPNPASSQVLKVWYNALIGTSKLEVFDVKGRLHHSTSVGNDRERAGLYELNISDLTPGLYIVRLSSGLYKVAQKVVIR